MKDTWDEIEKFRDYRAERRLGIQSPAIAGRDIRVARI
jgi:hypothetical protein